MARRPLIFLILLASFPFSLSAQQATSENALNSTQKLGRRIFQQRCGVCHSQPSPAFPMYGPPLYKDFIEDNEEMVSGFIRDGSGRMPGFKYGLTNAEINAIVEYLKTVPKPPKKSDVPASKPQGPVD